jgi:hypothetical protein
MFNKLQLHEQENSTNKKQQSIIVVYIGLFTRSDVDANEHNKTISRCLFPSINVYIVTGPLSSFN